MNNNRCLQRILLVGALIISITDVLRASTALAGLCDQQDTAHLFLQMVGKKIEIGKHLPELKGCCKSTLECLKFPCAVSGPKAFVFQDDALKMELKVEDYIKESKPFTKVPAEILEESVLDRLLKHTLEESPDSLVEFLTANLKDLGVTEDNIAIFRGSARTSWGEGIEDKLSKLDETGRIMIRVAENEEGQITVKYLNFPIHERLKEGKPWSSDSVARQVSVITKTPDGKIWFSSRSLAEGKKGKVYSEGMEDSCVLCHRAGGLILPYHRTVKFGGTDLTGPPQGEYQGDHPRIPENFVSQMLKDRKKLQIPYGLPLPQDYPTLGIESLSTLDLAQGGCKTIKPKTKRLLMQHNALNCAQCHTEGSHAGGFFQMTDGALITAMPKMLKHFGLESKLDANEYDAISQCLLDNREIKLKEKTINACKSALDLPADSFMDMEGRKKKLTVEPLNTGKTKLKIGEIELDVANSEVKAYVDALVTGRLVARRLKSSNCSDSLRHECHTYKLGRNGGTVLVSAENEDAFKKIFMEEKSSSSPELSFNNEDSEVYISYERNKAKWTLILEKKGTLYTSIKFLQFEFGRRIQFYKNEAMIVVEQLKKKGSPQPEEVEKKRCGVFECVVFRFPDSKKEVTVYATDAEIFKNLFK